MQIQSKDCMEMERQKFCLFNLFSFKLQNLGELRVVFAQTNVVEEGVKGNQRWFGYTKRFS